MLEIVQIYDVSQNVKSLGLLEIIPDNRICWSIVNTEVYGSPLQNANFENPIFFMLERIQTQVLTKFSWPYDFKCPRLPRTTENDPIFNTAVYGSPPFKMHIFKIRLFLVRKGTNIEFEPNFHYLYGYMAAHLKKSKSENPTLQCVKLAQNTYLAQIS